MNLRLPAPLASLALVEQLATDLAVLSDGSLKILRLTKPINSHSHLIQQAQAVDPPNIPSVRLAKVYGYTLEDTREGLLMHVYSEYGKTLFQEIQMRKGLLRSFSQAQLGQLANNLVRLCRADLEVPNAKGIFYPGFVAVDTRVITSRQFHSQKQPPLQALVLLRQAVQLSSSNQIEPKLGEIFPKPLLALVQQLISQVSLVPISCNSEQKKGPARSVLAELGRQFSEIQAPKQQQLKQQQTKQQQAKQQQAKQQQEIKQQEAKQTSQRTSQLRENRSMEGGRRKGFHKNALAYTGYGGSVARVQGIKSAQRPQREPARFSVLRH